MPTSPLTDLLAELQPRHRAALTWFADHAGEVVPWPRALPDGTLLAGKAKGIYKPNWSEYALSVRQSLAGPYPDRPIQSNPDGTWTYHYYQEGLEIEERDASFTNRGLLHCWRDDAVEALEAAHIVAYRGPVTNHPSNGLLLRADLHSLFDYGLVSVDVEKTSLVVSPDIGETAYGEYRDKPIRLPRELDLRPSLEALRQHRESVGF